MIRLRIIATFSILAASSGAWGATGILHRVKLPAATAAELEETVLAEDEIVINSDDRHDVRIGNGKPGGVRIWNTSALTEPPTSFPRPVSFNGNPIALNGSYTIGAEGPHVYLRCNGSNIVSILAQASGLGAIISRSYAGSNTLRVIIAVDDQALEPLVEFSPSILAPAWTDCVYSASRPSTNVMQLDIDIPQDQIQGYYRITALSGHRMRIGIPLEASEATFGDGVVVGTTSREIKRTLRTDALALEGGDNWDTGAFLELGGDDSTGEVSGGSAQLIMRNTSSRFRVRERTAWTDALEVYGDGRVAISGAVFMRAGTNMLLIIDGVTNRIQLIPQ